MSSSSVEAASLVADSAVHEAANHEFRGTITDDWHVNRGAHDCYQSAMLLGTLIAADAFARRPFSLRIYFLHPAAVGDVQIVVVPERIGRSVSIWQARLHQADNAVVLAAACFGLESLTGGVQYLGAALVPDPAECGRFVLTERTARYFANCELRSFLDVLPFSTSKHPPTDGWLRLFRPEPLDSCAIATMTDAWTQAIYAALPSLATVPTWCLSNTFNAYPPAVWSIASGSTGSGLARGK